MRKAVNRGGARRCDCQESFEVSNTVVVSYNQELTKMPASSQ